MLASSYEQYTSIVSTVSGIYILLHASNVIGSRRGLTLSSFNGIRAQYSFTQHGLSENRILPRTCTIVTIALSHS